MYGYLRRGRIGYILSFIFLLLSVTDPLYDRFSLYTIYTIHTIRAPSIHGIAMYRYGTIPYSLRTFAWKFGRPGFSDVSEATMTMFMVMIMVVCVAFDTGGDRWLSCVALLTVGDFCLLMKENMHMNAVSVIAQSHATQSAGDDVDLCGTTEPVVVTLDPPREGLDLATLTPADFTHVVLDAVGRGRIAFTASLAFGRVRVSCTRNMLKLQMQTLDLPAGPLIGYPSMYPDPVTLSVAPPLELISTWKMLGMVSLAGLGPLPQDAEGAVRLCCAALARSLGAHARGAMTFVQGLLGVLYAAHGLISDRRVQRSDLLYSQTYGYKSPTPIPPSLVGRVQPGGPRLSPLISRFLPRPSYPPPPEMYWTIEGLDIPALLAHVSVVGTSSFRPLSDALYAILPPTGSAHSRMAFERLLAEQARALGLDLPDILQRNLPSPLQA